MRILLVEDNYALNQLVLKHLNTIYVVDQVNDIDQARFFLETKNYDLLMIDADTVGVKSEQFCHYLKTNHHYLLILLLTPELTIEQKVNCLQSGSDYLMKPFHILELLNKIRSLLHKKYLKWQKILNSHFELNQITHQAYVSGQEINLNRKEYALLELFLYHPQQILSKTTLAEKIWHDDQVLRGNTIATTIAHLRKKIGKDFIKNIKGVGYIAK